MIRPYVASAILVLGGLANAGPVDTSSLESQIERARELSTTVPWSETKALLDEIEPRLAEVTPGHRADFWLIRARNLSLAGNMETALGTLEELFNEPLTLRQKVRAYSLAANIALLLRRWEETFGYLDRAMALAEELDPVDSTTVPHSLAAYVYAKIGEVEQAIEYGKRAVELARKHGSARDICLSQGRLAFVYKTAEMFDLAHRHYREALERCLDTGDELVTGTIESGLADLLRATGDFEQALDLFQQALPRLKATNYHFGLAEARFYKARLHWEQQEYETTAVLLEQALSPLENDEAWDYVAEAYGMLSEIEAEQANLEQALDYTHQRLEARERFLDLERARQLAHLQVAFDLQSREQELALLREQRRVAELETESRRQRERLRWVVYAFAAFLFLVLLLLLAHALRERRHFRRLAGLDSLTGLSNHTRFFDAARMLVDETRHSKRPLILVIADIDYFKRINDEFGHVAGDHALIEVARIMREGFPDAGVIGRIGGEEFAVCLRGMSIDEALRRLDAVREAMERIDYAIDGKPLTMSFGLAQLAPNEALEDLRLRTDEALYRAKRDGRNGVVIAEQPAR